MPLPNDRRVPRYPDTGERQELQTLLAAIKRELVTLKTTEETVVNRYQNELAPPRPACFMPVRRVR